MPILKEAINLQLLFNNSVLGHMKRYNFLRIGLAQVALKPLHRVSLNIYV